MALSATLVWEVRVTGNSANGGAFRGTALAGTPSAPAVTGAATGGTVAAGTYYVVLTYSPGGETRESPISGETSVTLAGTTSKFTVTHPTDPGNGATYNVYVGTTSGGPYFPQGTALTISADRVVTATPPTTGTQPPGVDYSQQDSPQVSYTDIVIGGTTTTGTSAGNPFTPAMVGNVLNVTSGTGFTVQRAEITGVTAAGVATFDKSLGTAASTGGTGKLGGAIDLPSTLNPVIVSGNIAFFKYSASPFLFAAALTNSSTNGCWFVGYDTTRTVGNTDANRPTFRPSANGIVMWTINGGTSYFVNVKWDNPSATFTGVAGLFNVGNPTVLRCDFTDLTSYGVLVNGLGRVESCLFTRITGGQTLYLNAASLVLRCEFRSCSVVIRVSADACAFVDCTSYGATGDAFFVVSGATCTFIHCNAYGGSGNGFTGQSGSGGVVLYDRCTAWGNAGFGFAVATTGRNGARLVNCRAGNNTAGDYQTSRLAADQVAGFVTLTGDPFTNAAAFDFSLNNTAGAGAACRGLTVAFPGGTTTSYPDAGAAQHADTPASVVIPTRRYVR